MPDDKQQPVFQIQRVYLKALLLEQPNSPAIFLEEASPAVEVAISTTAMKQTEGIFESTVSVTVTAKIQDKVAFVVEGKQAGFLKSATCLLTNLTRYWASVVRPFCTLTCGRTWPMPSPVQVFRRCICLKSIFRCFTSNDSKSWRCSRVENAALPFETSR